jgi:hypothetical protein
VYASGVVPLAWGAIDKEMQSRTPAYMYGWVIARAELYEALKGKPCASDRFLEHIYVGAGNRFYAMWTEKGYDKNEYKLVPHRFEFLYKLICPIAPTFHLSNQLALTTS